MVAQDVPAPQVSLEHPASPRIFACPQVSHHAANAHPDLLASLVHLEILETQDHLVSMVVEDNLDAMVPKAHLDHQALQAQMVSQDKRVTQVVMASMNRAFPVNLAHQVTMATQDPVAHLVNSAQTETTETMEPRDRPAVLDPQARMAILETRDAQENQANLENVVSARNIAPWTEASFSRMEPDVKGRRFFLLGNLSSCLGRECDRKYDHNNSLFININFWSVLLIVVNFRVKNV